MEDKDGRWVMLESKGCEVLDMMLPFAGAFVM